MSDVHDTFVTYQKAVHNDVLLPTVDHGNFLKDKNQQYELLQLLYNKLAIEHRSPKGGSHELFLSFDENRRGVLSTQEFRDAMMRVGVSLTDDQLSWLVNRFDCDHDGAVNYNEFVRMLTQWRGEEGKTGTTATGLVWDYEKLESPHKEQDEKREAAKRVVEEQYKKAHQHHGRESLDGLAVKDVLAKLTQGIFETKGGMKNAFHHWDKDKDNLLSKEELRCAMEELDMDVPDRILDRTYRTFDVDQSGGKGIRYWEFVRALSEACDGIQQQAEDPSVLPSSSDEVPVDEDDQGESGEGVAEDGRTDKQVLSDVAIKLHEQGLHAHNVIKQLMPETDGTVDAQELRLLFKRIGVAISVDRAKRLMAMADLMHNGRLAGWEFVRLLAQGSSDAPVTSPTAKKNG